MYMAPECLKGKIGLSNDVWSIGIVLIKLLTATPAWGDVIDLFHLYAQFQDETMPSGLSLVPEGYQSTIKLCLVYASEKRPPMSEILASITETTLTVVVSY